jgi:hypothetical protein
MSIAEKALPSRQGMDIYLCYNRGGKRFEYLTHDNVHAAFLESARFGRCFDDALKYSKRVIIYIMSPGFFPYIARIPDGIEVVWYVYSPEVEIYTACGIDVGPYDFLAPKTATFVKEHATNVAVRRHLEIWRRRFANFFEEAPTIMADAKLIGLTAALKELWASFSGRILYRPFRGLFKSKEQLRQKALLAEKLRHDALARIDVVAMRDGPEYDLLLEKIPCLAKASRKDISGLIWGDDSPGDLSELDPKLYEKVKDRFVILLGCSARWMNNHIDAIDALASLNLPGDALVVAPLPSYNGTSSNSVIADYAIRRLGNKFLPLYDYRPTHVYDAFMSQAGVAIMNHGLSSGGMGTIMSLMCYGKKVFLNETGYNYRLFQHDNATFLAMPMSRLTVEELYSPPDTASVDAFKKYLIKRWGQEAVYKMYRNLLS